MQAFKLKKKEGFLLSTAESGLPVDTMLFKVEVSDRKQPLVFTEFSGVDLSTAVLSTAIPALGLLEVELDKSIQAVKKAKILRFTVKHDHPGPHWGTIILDDKAKDGAGAQ